MTPAERVLRGRIGALTVHSRGRTNTAPARAAFDARFYDEVDPDRVLAEAERDRRASFARKTYFARLALASSLARSGRRHTP